LGDKLFLQKNGIPMGAAPSPQYCDLYLSSCELQACRRLMAAPSGHSILRNLRFWFRLMDDLRFINQPDVAHLTDSGEVFKIYPKCLGLTETTWSKEMLRPGIKSTTVFLDIKTETNFGGQFVVSRFLKEEALAFEPIKYVQADSNRPAKNKLNSILTMVLNALGHSSSMKVFLKDLAKIMHKYKQNGFTFEQMWRRISPFYSKISSRPGYMFKLKALTKLALEGLLRDT
jgi:hypothetical protein